MHTCLIAEVGINGNGSMKITKQLIDLAVEGGASYIKFQKRTVEDVYTKEELDKPRESPWGTTNREQKHGLEFGKEEYDEIDKYCKEKGINWFSSPWDLKSVDFLMQYNPKYIKVASAMLTNEELLNKIKEATEGKQTRVIIATGMSTKEEIDRCIEILGEKIDYILSCTSSYPTPIEDLNINKMKTLKEHYGERYGIGFSNHSSGIIGMVMACTLGAEIIEYHITLDRTMYGSDQASSIEKSGVLKLRDYVESIEKAFGDGEIKCMPSEIPIKEKLRK